MQRYSSGLKSRAYMQMKREAVKERLERERKQTNLVYLLSFLSIFISFVILYALIESEKEEYYSSQELHSYDRLNMSSEEDFREKKLKKTVKLDAPLISQLPELPRGCEVTSLAMLLKHAGVDVDKMALAKEVKKDKTPYSVKGGAIYFGNPYDGFVGDMYSLSRPGFAVFHGPIAVLADKYLPEKIVDMTGSDFKDILYHISDDRPVWVMVNVYYRELEDHYYQTWQTPNGPVQITFKTHSVLMTGYDETYIYFNDPLTNTKNRKANRRDFEKSWKQMGRQAITYKPMK